MGQRMASPTNEENQVLSLFSGSRSEKPVAMMQMMAPTVTIVGNQHMMTQTPYGIQPMQQQFSQYC